MDGVSISDFLDGAAALIEPTHIHDPTEIPEIDLISLFERRGALVFRGFDVNPQKFKEFTDIYTESYARDAMRRPYRFGEDIIRGVDPGFDGIKLHSEASFTPAWPEIIWLYCIMPPSNQGETTLCDGVALWHSLSLEAKQFFLLNPIRYDLEVPVANKKPGKGKRPWVLNTPGTGNAFIDWDEGLLHFTLLRHAVHEGRQLGSLCFANHLFIDLDSEDQLIRRTMIDGTDIPAHLMQEIRDKSVLVTKDVKWQPGDVLMLDNKQFMHGRRAFLPGDARDIVIAQSARASFGWGSTTRNQVDKRRA